MAVTHEKNDAGDAAASPTVPENTVSMIVQADGGTLHFTEDGVNDPTPDTDDSTPDGVGSMIADGGSFEIYKNFGNFKYCRKKSSQTVAARFRYETGDAP